MAAASVSVIRGSPSCLLPLWEALQDLQVSLSQATFKLLSVRDLGTCEILHAPFKSRVYVSCSPLALPYASPTGLQSQHSGGLSSQCRTPGLRSLIWGPELSLLGENPCSCDYTLVCGMPTGGVGLDYTVSPPLLPVSLWFLLYIFSCEKSFLLVFRSVSSIVICK